MSADTTARTFTRDGVTYPWEGPVYQYYKDEREPEIRSRVYVRYFNMNNEDDRTEMSRIMTNARNGKYHLVNDPLYTTPESGHTHITVIFETQFACDPMYDMNETTDVTVHEGKNRKSERSEKESSEEPYEDTEDKTVSEFPEEAIQSSPLKSSEDIESEQTQQEPENGGENS